MVNADLRDFGGKPDGTTDNTEAFAAALASLRSAGGGTLMVGPGIWSTGPVELFSRTALRLDERAVISFIPEPDRYRPVRTRWEGVECYGMHPCIFASGQEDITLSGGRIDGNGRTWWDTLAAKRRLGQEGPRTSVEQALAELNPGYRDQPGGGGGRNLQFLRPPLIQFFNCSNVRLTGFTAANSPFWTIHPVYSDMVVIDGVTIRNPHDSPNTDGIDIDSCSNVSILNCTVSVGDDGIALKSGSGPDGIRVNRPTRNVTVRNCTVGDGHGGIVIGSETAGGIYNVVAEDCRFLQTDRGIRIKSRRGRGGEIANLLFRNLQMEGNLCPFVINMFYRCGASLEDGLFGPEARPVDSATPSVRNVELSGIRAFGSRGSAGFIAGLPESPVENLAVRDCVFSTDEESGVSPDDSDMFLGIPSAGAKGFRILNAVNADFSGVRIEGPAEPFIRY